jgi:hypothetical protein
MPFVDVDLEVFDDDDLIKELTNRGYHVADTNERRLQKDVFQLLKSLQCDSDEVFDKNIRDFYDRWYTEL